VRPHFVGGAVTLVVRDNESLVGATRWGGSFCWLAAPGIHTLVVHPVDSTWETKSDVAVFVDGGRYYLDEETEVDGFRLQWMTEQDAAEAMENCEYQMLVATPTRERAIDPSAIVPAQTAQPLAQKAPAGR
jgi:hypothetical protein